MGASPQRSLTTNVNGTNRNNNNTRIDGATNVYIWLPHHTLYNPPVESIETVNISTSSFDAEQGMAGGAAVTVATKSGTNQLHGSAFWYHDNQHLYARPYFYKSNIDHPALNKSIVNIPGGTIGGPIIKNKLFYFFSFERTWERTGQFANSSVPPADMRAGDFAAYTGLGLIYDPLTGTAAGTGRTPFANNQIPSARFSPTWTKIQALAPLPNQPATDTYGLSGNYFSSATLGLTRDQYDIKSNYNVNAKLMVWGKYSQMNAPVQGAGALGDSNRTRARTARHSRCQHQDPDLRLQPHHVADISHRRRLRLHQVQQRGPRSRLRQELGLGGLGHSRHQRRQDLRGKISAIPASLASTTASPRGATARRRTPTSTTITATPTPPTSPRCRVLTNSAGASTSFATR